MERGALPAAVDGFSWTAEPGMACRMFLGGAKALLEMSARANSFMQVF
jgi:hypothetical protein